MRFTFWLITFISLLSASNLVAQTMLDYQNYREVFRDDFTYARKEEMTKNWRFTHPYYPEHGWGDEYFSPDQVTLRSDGKLRHTGLLRLSAVRLKEPHPTSLGNKLFVSGMIESVAKIDSTENCKGMYNPGFTYGMFEIRCKLPRAQYGAWPTFWFLSSDTEIDVIDNLKPNPAAVIQSGVIDWTKRAPHDSSAQNSKGGIIDKRYGAPLSAGFNTYTAVWSPNRVSFFFNGRHLYDADEKEVATYACSGMLLATLQMKDIDHAMRRAHMDIDYIRVLKPLNDDYSLAYKTTSSPANEALTASLPNVSLAVGSLVINPMSPEEVFYRGKDDELYHALRKGKRWKIKSLHQITNTQEEDYLVNSPLRYDVFTNKLTYEGRDGQIQSFTFSTAWQHVTSPPGSL